MYKKSYLTAQYLSDVELNRSQVSDEFNKRVSKWACILLKVLQYAACWVAVF